MEEDYEEMGCRNCRWCWERHGALTCHLEPPRCIVKAEGRVTTAWPFVEPDDLCSRYEDGEL